MAEPFVGEIRMFGGNFAPSGWAFCSGQLMAISQNTAFFSLIGTTYGGDGTTTFALPDLRSRMPMHMGTNPQNGIGYVLGQSGGTETVTLTANQMPVHIHGVQCQSVGSSAAPAGNFWATDTTVDLYNTNASPSVAMNSAAIASTGGSQPHNNLMPFLAVSFIISLFGIFPSRN